jgi:hypothetical protein
MKIKLSAYVSQQNAFISITFLYPLKDMHSLWIYSNFSYLSKEKYVQLSLGSG